MKLNWKQIAQCPGYKSLSKAYQKDVQDANRSKQRGYHPMRDKAEFYERFKFAIGRAIHYAHVQKRTVEEVLNEWEADRNSWWFGWYGQSHISKLNKSKGINTKVNTLRRIKRYNHVGQFRGRYRSRKPLSLVEIKEKQARSLRQLKFYYTDKAKARRKATGKKDRWPWWKKRESVS